MNVRTRPSILLALVLLALLVAACGGAPPLPSGEVTTSPSPVASATSSPVAAASPSPSRAPLPLSPTQALIEQLTARIEADGSDGAAHRDLGLALLQRIRETADPSLYGPAFAALETARKLLPEDPVVLLGIGGLQLGRHEFAEALATAEETLTLAPGFASALAVQA
ncbi:MAG: hypothetical protein H0V74_07595, partial [Chloroflexi bacterium]|nr:hypothetical protein [Chloroflexota bacterium]